MLPQVLACVPLSVSQSWVLRPREYLTRCPGACAAFLEHFPALGCMSKHMFNLPACCP